MANSSRPSLRDRIFAPSARKKQQDVGDAPPSRRVPFYRRKGDDSAQSLVKPSSRSFLSKVVTKVVPCVSGPATPIDLGTAPNDQEPVKTPPLDLSPLAAGFSITPSSSSPPSPVDSDVVVPPPVSAALLPEDETDGMTSGAVQPPGSSGTTEMFHTPTSHDSDSDRTSYSEDDHVQDEIDEEERLIRNGGSGIPIDLVRPHPTSTSIHTHHFLPHRTVGQNPCSRP
jgi:RNA polymerase II subunit A small phosphatase-like protein